MANVERFYVGGRFRGRWPIYDTHHRNRKGVCRVFGWYESKKAALDTAARINAGNFTLEELQKEIERDSELLPISGLIINGFKKHWNATVAGHGGGMGTSLPAAVKDAFQRAYDARERAKGR